MKRVLLALLALLLILSAALAVYLYGKQPQRSGSLNLSILEAPVTVRFDNRGVPHIRAQNQNDLYRALGYVHAQDRLFQMEIMRRLARGELAEILGEKLVPADRLFRTLELRAHAERYVERMDPSSSSVQALQHYLDGINAYQETRALPLEFDLLGITPRPFTMVDTLSVAGYTAYSFAAALRTEPVLSHIRAELGGDYLKIFDLDWHPEGVVASPLKKSDWQDLAAVALLSHEVLDKAGVTQFEGSNAWAISGRLTASGKPLLAGDPHIRFALPAVWYEAHLQAPDYELYGYHHALVPSAMLGHNSQFAWSLTMFQNDDLDLIAETVNPDNPDQVRYQGQWVELERRVEQIAVKGQEPVELTLRRSPHGPIINDALGEQAGNTPIAMWWAFLETDNPLLDAFYHLNRADTLDKARAAAELIEAPGLNVIWANAAGDIAWWAAAKLPIRPDGVNPTFILDADKGEAQKLGFYPFSANPQEENPERGYILSANYQPLAPSGMPIPGYYNLADRGQRLQQHLSQPAAPWDLANNQALQLEKGTDYPQRVLAPILDELRAAAQGDEVALIDALAQWNGQHTTDSLPATLFNQLLYQLAQAALADELGEMFFNALLQTRAIDAALPRLTADALSPWWQQNGQPRSRAEIVAQAWQATLAHLRQQFGEAQDNWRWGNTHTLTHNHPLGVEPPLSWLLNAGPYAAPGSHEVPNNLSHRIGPAPWAVIHGPSTRRLVDLASVPDALGGNPVGQSGVLFDRHYRDQAAGHVRGEYRPQYFSQAQIEQHLDGELQLLPQP